MTFIALNYAVCHYDKVAFSAILIVAEKVAVGDLNNPQYH